MSLESKIENQPLAVRRVVLASGWRQGLTSLSTLIKRCVMDGASQTIGIQKNTIIHPDLCKIAAYVNSSFPEFQVRSLVCGQLSQHHAIEV